MGRNTETTDSAATAKSRWSNKVKWGIRGGLIMVGILILWTACLIAITYLGAVEPALITHRRPVLLDPALGPEAQGDEKLQLTGASQVSVAANHPTSGTAPANAAPRLQFKPFVNADPVLVDKLKGHREALNQRFDAILVRIARYEAMNASMDLETATKEMAAINGEFYESVKDLARLLGLPAEPLLMGSGVERYLSARIMEYWHWQFSAQASLDAKRNRYDLAAFHIKSARRMQELAYKFIMFGNPDQARTFSIWDFHHSKMDQEMWTQEVYYWRKVGGFSGLKGIGQSVIERKLLEFGWSIKMLHQ